MPIRQEGITMGRYNFEQHTRDGYVVTPALAKQWLEKNTNNRNVNFAKVKKMARICARVTGTRLIKALRLPPMARWSMVSTV